MHEETSTKKFLNLHQTLSPISTANGKHGGHNNNNTLGSAADQLTVAVSVPPVNSDSLTAVNCQPVPVTVSDVITTAALTSPVANGLHNGLVTGAEDPNDKVRA